MVEAAQQAFATRTSTASDGTVQSLVDPYMSRVLSAQVPGTDVLAATVVLACGFGKTAVAPQIVLADRSVRTMVFVAPLLSLVEQTVHSVRRSLADIVGRNCDADVMAVGSLQPTGFVVSMNPAVIRAHLFDTAEGFDGVRVVVVTFDSLHHVRAAVVGRTGGPPWVDRLVVDEAHWTTGGLDPVSRADAEPDPKRLPVPDRRRCAVHVFPALHRLYMTGTPAVHASNDGRAPADGGNGLCIYLSGGKGQDAGGEGVMGTDDVGDREFSLAEALGNALANDGDDGDDGTPRFGAREREAGSGTDDETEEDSGSEGDGAAADGSKRVAAAPALVPGAFACMNDATGPFGPVVAKCSFGEAIERGRLVRPEYRPIVCWEGAGSDALRFVRAAEGTCTGEGPDSDQRVSPAMHEFR